MIGALVLTVFAEPLFIDATTPLLPVAKNELALTLSPVGIVTTTTTVYVVDACSWLGDIMKERGSSEADTRDTNCSPTYSFHSYMKVMSAASDRQDG